MSEGPTRDNASEHYRWYLERMREHIDNLLKGKVIEGNDLRLRLPVPSHAWWLGSADVAFRLSESRDRLQAAPLVHCPLASMSTATSGNSPPLEALVVSGGRHLGLKEIRDFTRDATNLIVIDPYAYGGEKATAGEYAKEFARAARFRSKVLEAVHIVYSSRHGKAHAVKKALADSARNDGVRLTDCDCDSIHDRVWIKDRAEGLAVGTSLGGLGKRATFLLELPVADLNYLLDYVDENNLSRATS